MRLHALFLLVAVLACACASVPPPSPSPRPVKAGPSTPSAPIFGKRDLHVHLRHVAHPERPHLEVTLTFRGDPSGRTNLRLPTTWAGHDELWRGLENVRVDPPARDRPGGDPSMRTLLHKPDALLHIRYEVRSATLDAGEERQPYRPIVSADHVHLIGETFLATPEWDDAAFVHVRRTRTSSDPTRECEVHVGPRGGEVRVFRYLPQGEPRAVPQYRLDEAGYERNGELCLAAFR